MKLRPSRQRRKGRIEIIPMIDVMFFLLATFMLASLSLQNLHSLAVNLPRGQAPPLQSMRSVTLTVTRGGEILLDQTAVTLDTLAAVLRPMLAPAGTNVVVAADSAAPSGIVVQAMLQARGRRAFSLRRDAEVGLWKPCAFRTIRGAVFRGRRRWRCCSRSCR